MSTVNPNEFATPGDIIKNVKSSKGVTVIGPGLRQNEDQPNTLCVTQAGILYFKEPNTYWIQGKRRRYIPKKGDAVVGVVTKKAGDTLRVDIGSAEFASLSMLAFEGATKKQKPDVQVGDVVYAKLLNAHREMEPELVCIDSYFKAGNLGVLSDGFLISICLNLAERLLQIENPLLGTIAKKFSYEIVVGANGKVWIYTKQPKDVLTIIKTLKGVKNHSDKSVVEMCSLVK